MILKGAICFAADLMRKLQLTFRTRVILSSIYLNFDLNLTNSGQYYLNIAAKLANPAEKQLNANLKHSGAKRELQVPFQIEFLSASSYGQSGTKRGKLFVNIPEDLDLREGKVLLIDDIYDSGETLSVICNLLNAKSLKSLILLKKKVKVTGSVVPNYVLFDIEDHFVVDYGLDYKEHYRGMPDICILEE